jgi:hypothetical protein
MELFNYLKINFNFNLKIMEPQRVDYFNLAQEAQREGRWRDALAYIEEGNSRGCPLCKANLIDCCRREYWGKSSKDEDRSMNIDVVVHISLNRRMNQSIHNKEERLACLAQAAENGNPVDQFNFAKEITEGSLDWFRKSANQLYFPSQKYLYEYFMTNETNYLKAAYWYKQIPKNDRYVKTFLYNQDEIFDGIGKCQRACYQLILIRKYRQSILNWIPKDVVLMIARILLSSFEDTCWQERRSRRLREKKRNKYTK